MTRYDLFEKTLQHRMELLDYGMDYTQLIVPGSLGNIKAVDDREPDCHKWILNHMYDNEYQIGERDRRFFNVFDFRREYIRRYGFVLPNKELLDAIKKYSPDGVLDMGAGIGYLSFLLKWNDVDVIAADWLPPELGNNQYFVKSKHWHKIIHRTSSFAASFPCRSLLLAWPPMDTMASHALRHYTGDTVLYIGEMGGCTGDDDFHEALDSEPWVMVDCNIGISFFGTHDRLHIYKRKH